jgi:hypothetical protein
MDEEVKFLEYLVLLISFLPFLISVQERKKILPAVLYWFQIWSLTLRDKRSPRVLSGVFGLKSEKKR